MEISQMSGYLRNFPDTQAFGKFPRYPGIWEISQIPIGIWGWYNLKILETSQMTEYVSQNIPRISGYLGNSSNVWVFGEFLVIWEISKILKIYHTQISVGIWEIS